MKDLLLSLGFAPDGAFCFNAEFGTVTMTAWAGNAPLLQIRNTTPTQTEKIIRILREDTSDADAVGTDIARVGKPTGEPDERHEEGTAG